MSTEQTKKPEKQKKPIQVLRDRCGGMSSEMKAYYKDLTQTRKKLREAIALGPATVPELAKATSLDTTMVMWHVMAMKKYSQVAEGELAGGYYRYSLKEAADGRAT